MFRWTWQIGQALQKKGQISEAQKAYERAEVPLVAVREDLVTGMARRGPGADFRHELGPFCDELADFYFARSSSTHDADELKKARNAAERFKSALLEDYFHDPSITTYRSPQRHGQPLGRR